MRFAPPADARRRLLARIQSRYQVVTESVQLGAVRFPFTRIADPDTVLEEVAAEEGRLKKTNGRPVAGDDYLQLPYWAELWDSATGVALALQQPAFQWHPENASVLDLGCGMGLSGTAAAGLGARVVFADLEPPALLFARLNAFPFSSTRKKWDGERPWAPRIRTRHLDWRTDRLGERFDLIIGADILYEQKQWVHLEPFWRAHLATGGQLLLGEPQRASGENFPKWIRERGWELETLEQPVPKRAKPIRLFVVRRAE